MARLAPSPTASECHDAMVRSGYPPHLRLLAPNAERASSSSSSPAVFHAPGAHVDHARAERPCLDELQIDPLVQRGKYGVPPPTITALTKSRYSSMRSSLMKVEARPAPPTARSFPGWSFVWRPLRRRCPSPAWYCPRPARA